MIHRGCDARGLEGRLQCRQVQFFWHADNDRSGCEPSPNIHIAAVDGANSEPL